jgi:hypothetical protein
MVQEMSLLAAGCWLLGWSVYGCWLLAAHCENMQLFKLYLLLV